MMRFILTLKNEIYVAIADVSEYVYAYSAIDKEARNRGFSIYFPHIAIPMLPHPLSENICSLKPHLDRLAYCFKITLDHENKVIKEELLKVLSTQNAVLIMMKLMKFGTKT